MVAAIDCHSSSASLRVAVAVCSPDQFVFEIASRGATGWMKNCPVPPSPEPPMFHRNFAPLSTAGFVSTTIVAADCPASSPSGSFT